MASQKQIEANRNNAMKSTGPKSASGLQVVAQNAVKHGVFSTQSLLLPGEDGQAYEELREQFYKDFQATTRIEQLLVEKMAQAFWKKQRLAIFEQHLITVQQEEQTLNARIRQKAFQTERSTQLLEAEIKALKDEGESIQLCLETCEKYNRMRPGPKREEEGIGMAEYIADTINDAQERLCAYVDSSALHEAKQTHPKYPEGRYARTLILNSVTHRVDENEKQDKPAHPVYTYGLEKLGEILQERREALTAQLEIKRQRQILVEDLASVGLDLLPNENNLVKIQRYEAYLDNLFYKALHELQRLQGFLVQKKKAIDL